MPGASPVQSTRATGAASTANVSLSLGDKGGDVNVLQQALGQLGYFKGTPNGKFDQATQDAVKAFQSKHGLAATGVVDNALVSQLGSELVGKRKASSPDNGKSFYFPPPSQPGDYPDISGLFGSELNPFVQSLGEPDPTSSGTASWSPEEISRVAGQYKPGSYGGQCSGFVASCLHIKGFPRSDGLGPVNGNEMVNYLCNSQGFHRVSTPQPGDAFSMNIGQYGHTGIVVGVNGNKVKVIDSNWGLDQKVQVHEIDISQFSGFARKN